METRKIVLEKEMRIPDTDIILEAGDELIIHEEAILNEEELVEEFGPAGYLSSMSWDEFLGKGVDPQDIMIAVNMELLDLSDGKHPELNRFDFRVDAVDHRGKVAITYPREVIRNKKFQKLYKDLITKALGSKGIRESIKIDERLRLQRGDTFEIFVDNEWRTLVYYNDYEQRLGGQMTAGYGATTIEDGMRNGWIRVKEEIKEALGSNFVGSCVYEGKVYQVYDNGNSYTFTWDGGLGKQELTKKEFDRLDIIDGRYTESIQFKIEESIQKKEAVDIYALHRRDKGDINKARFFKTYPSSLDFFNHMRRLGYSRIDMGMPEVLGSDTAYEKPDTGERLFIYSTYNESINEAVDIKKIIKDLQGDFGGNNESQMKGVQLLKGLATSEDPLSNKFMKALNTAMTTISKEVLGD